jgi:hypothetical protein
MVQVVTRPLRRVLPTGLEPTARTARNGRTVLPRAARPPVPRPGSVPPGPCPPPTINLVLNHTSTPGQCRGRAERNNPPQRPPWPTSPQSGSPARSGEQVAAFVLVGAARILTPCRPEPEDQYSGGTDSLADRSDDEHGGINNPQIVALIRQAVHLTGRASITAGCVTTRRAFDQGIVFTLARVWRPGTLRLERQIKARGPVNYCPLCPRRSRAADRARSSPIPA